jgi:death on curing protein
VKNHALIDGNERLGWLATARFLELNGSSVSNLSDDAVYDLVINVASANGAIEHIAASLQRLVDGG